MPEQDAHESPVTLPHTAAAPSPTHTSASGSPTPSSGLSAAVRAVSGVTLLSRFGGLIRDIVLVRTFGDTPVGSAFAAAFAIPNMFRRLFGEGALSAAFIPEYTNALRDSKDPSQSPTTDEDLGPTATPKHDARTRPVQESDRFASLVILALGAVTGAITVIAELALLGILLFGSPDEELRLSIGLVMVTLPFMPFVCAAAIKAGMLQVHGKFGASMSGPLVLNTFIIVVGGWCWLKGSLGGPTVAYVLAGATVLSGFTQMVWFSILLRRHVRFTLDVQAARPRAKRMLRKFVPVMLGLGTLQVNAFVDTLIAMWPTWVGPTMLGLEYPLSKSSNAVMTFTQRLYQFPLGVFGIAVATAAFPMLSRHAHDTGKFLHTIQRGVRLSLFIGLPASIGLALVRYDATAVLFGFGNNGFSADGLIRSAAVLMGFATGIWAYSLNHLYTRVFYAKGDTMSPMKVSVAMVLLNITLNFTLIWKLDEAGLAWSTSICAMLQCLILGAMCRRFVPGVQLLDSPTLRGIAKVILATILMGAAVWFTLRMLGTRTTWTQHATALCIAMGVGFLVFAGSCFGLRIHEARWLLRRSE